LFRKKNIQSKKSIHFSFENIENALWHEYSLTSTVQQNPEGKGLEENNLYPSRSGLKGQAILF
jgi:hypothetical protein